MNKILSLLSVLLLVLVGCDNPVVGADKDDHGCISSAGYSWCEKESKCVRPWELAKEKGFENTPSDFNAYCANNQASDELIVGDDKDDHGCIGSAGYSWCEIKGRCIRSWEESCEEDIKDKAKKFCTEEDVESVYVCGDHFKVISSLLGGGTTIYKQNGSELRCPLVAPDSMSEECRQFMVGDNCAEMNICESKEAMDKEKCTAAGGRWNDCGNRCKIDNQGKDGVACAMMCEAICECGGISSLGCPEGYTCNMPEGVVDALGYCE